MMNEEVETSAANERNTAGSTSASSEAVETSIEASGNSATSGNPITDEPKLELAGDDDDIQLEPTKSEMERERLLSRAEQLQDDIIRLQNELVDKDAELTEIKKKLGITPFTEFKQSMSNSWKVVGNKWKEVQETETFRKIDSTLSGWKEKVEGSNTYQKTVSTLNEGGKKMSGGISSAGTKIKESETLKSVGEKTSSALRRTGTAIKDTGTAIKESETMKNVGSKISGAAASLKEKVWSSTDQADGGVPNGNNPTKGETVVPDEPTKE